MSTTTIWRGMASRAFGRCLLSVSILSVSILPASILLAAPLATAEILTLPEVVRQAQTEHPWLKGSELHERALASRAVAAGSLPDPQVSLGFANFPTDSFQAGQEPMTQVQLGVRQVLPRGNSRALQRQRLEQLSGAGPHQREERKAKVREAVTLRWLDWLQAKQSIALIEKNRTWFEQLVAVAQVRYTSAIQRTRQHDLVRAQLELSGLEERVALLHEQEQRALGELSEWFIAQGSGAQDDSAVNPRLSVAWPGLKPILNVSGDTQALQQYLLPHPAIKALEQRIDASGTEVELARQKYRPEWGLSASYGRRNDGPGGLDRPDLFTVGVTVDVPLFTANRQDRELEAAQASAAATRTWPRGSAPAEPQAPHGRLGTVTPADHTLLVTTHHSPPTPCARGARETPEVPESHDSIRVCRARVSACDLSH